MNLPETIRFADWLQFMALHGGDGLYITPNPVAILCLPAPFLGSEIVADAWGVTEID